MKKWKFNDLPNVAVISSSKVINKQSWIGYVTHDIDDGAWQFLEKKFVQPNIDDATVVSLQNIVELDPTIIELADLPLGWHAWRNNKASSWQREKIDN